jgi:hypothetical protein
VENVNDNVAKIEQDPSALTPTLLAYALCAIAKQTFFNLIGNRLNHALIASATDEENISECDVVGDIKSHQVGR